MTMSWDAADDSAIVYSVWMDESERSSEHSCVSTVWVWAVREDAAPFVIVKFPRKNADPVTFKSEGSRVLSQ